MALRSFRGYVVGWFSADTSYRTSVEYRLFILARFPQPPLDKRNGSALLFFINIRGYQSCTTFFYDETKFNNCYFGICIFGH